MEPIFVNEFGTPREPPRIKPVIKRAFTGTYLGRAYIVVYVDKDDDAIIHYVDDRGCIRQLAVPTLLL